MSDMLRAISGKTAIGMNHVTRKRVSSSSNNAATSHARRASLKVLWRTSKCRTLPRTSEFFFLSAVVRHLSWMATELPVSLSKNRQSSPSSSASGWKGERRPSLAFITALTRRFSPMAPICVEDRDILCAENELPHCLAFGTSCQASRSHLIRIRKTGSLKRAGLKSYIRLRDLPDALPHKWKVGLIEEPTHSLEIHRYG